MKQRTSEEIAQIFKSAGDSVTVINTETSKYSYETVDDWKNRIKRNVEHLETIKAYKTEDDTTSIWTTENFTDIDAAIVKGKTIYGG
tara:strand:+ start:2049 stop:2309 length:261 start_codon:yes stop_codon:yes gene_type:complete